MLRVKFAFCPRLKPRTWSGSKYITSVTRRHSRLRPSLAGSPCRPAVSSSSSYGLANRPPLLPTPPHDDAVAVDYRIKLKPPDRDFHPPDSANLQAHQGPLRGPRAIFFFTHRWSWIGVRTQGAHGVEPANRRDKLRRPEIERVTASRSWNCTGVRARLSSRVNRSMFFRIDRSGPMFPPAM